MILHGDALKVLRTLPAGAAQACMTSPPYLGLRDYKVPPTDWPEVTYVPMPGLPPMTVPAMTCALGQEPTPEAFTGHLVLIFREVHRILPDTGALFLNLGDSYAGNAKGETRTNPGAKIRTGAKLETLRGPARPAIGKGLPTKNLLGVPWRVAFALQADGWFLRQDIIWGKKSPMPESVTDRCTKAHEYLFLLTKRGRGYYWNREGIAEPASVGFAGSTFTKGKSLGHQSGKAGAGPRDGEGDRRPQLRRALELAEEKGITEEHIAALRSVGLGLKSQPKNRERQAGGNTPEVMRLAAEAEAALGSYAQEFLTGETRNPRSIWMAGSTPFPGAHFAVMSMQVAERAVLAVTPPQGVVLDPFFGAGTTGAAAVAVGREFLGIELNPENVEMATRRIRGSQPGLALFGHGELEESA